MSIGTFCVRVCACESAVAREGKPKRDSFEMMLNVQKDSAMQKSGRKTFYMWEVAPDKDQGNQVNKWLPSTANLPSMLGTWYTGQP